MRRDSSFAASAVRAVDRPRPFLRARRDFARAAQPAPAA